MDAYDDTAGATAIARTVMNSAGQGQYHGPRSAPTGQINLENIFGLGALTPSHTRWLAIDTAPFEN